MKFKTYSLSAYSLPLEVSEDLKVKKLHRKSETVLLTPKSFETYLNNTDSPVHIVGRIRKRQRHYKDYDDFYVLSKKKTSRKIIGQATLLLNGVEKKYDIKADADQHTYGYAYVGNHRWIRVTTFNPLLLLLPLFCATLMAILFRSCPNRFMPVDIIDDEITTEDAASDEESAPLCYYVPFNEKTLLTAERQTVNLLNVKDNEGTYYISYQVYLDNEPLLFEVTDGVFFMSNSQNENAVTSIGAIAPGKQATLNFWQDLDAGTYDLTVVATDYDYSLFNEYAQTGRAALLEQATQPVTHTLKTTLVVEK